MTQLARMRFVSLTKPKERGMLVLHDDGTFQVVPSEELRDEMARLEEVALHRAHLFGTRSRPRPACASARWPSAPAGWSGAFSASSATI